MYNFGNVGVPIEGKGIESIYVQQLSMMINHILDSIRLEMTWILVFAQECVHIEERVPLGVKLLQYIRKQDPFTMEAIPPKTPPDISTHL